MRKIILIVSLAFAILCFIFVYFSNSGDPRLITKRDGSTVKLTGVKLCTSYMLWPDTTSGDYEFSTQSSRVELPRDFDGIQRFEIIEGCDDQDNYRYGLTAPGRRILSVDQLKKMVDDLQRDLKDLQTAKKPDVKKTQEVQERLQKYEKDLAEAKRKSTLLKLKITYDNGDTAEGHPNQDIVKYKNYILGYSEHSKVTILLQDIVSVIKDN